MTGFVHAALGAALGRFIKNKPVAFAVGFASHLLGDVVPHKDMGIGELPLLGGTLFHIIHRHGVKSPQFWGALGAISPDFEHIYYELKKDPRRFAPMKEKFFPTHTRRAYQLEHGTWPLGEKWGLMMTFSLFVIGLWLADAVGRD